MYDSGHSFTVSPPHYRFHFLNHPQGFSKRTLRDEVAVYMYAQLLIAAFPAGAVGSNRLSMKTDTPWKIVST